MLPAAILPTLSRRGLQTCPARLRILFESRRVELLSPFPHLPCAASRVFSSSHRGCESAQSDPAPLNTTSPAPSSNRLSNRLSRSLVLPSQLLAAATPTQSRQKISVLNVCSTQMLHSAPSHAAHRYSV